MDTAFIPKAVENDRTVHSDIHQEMTINLSDVDPTTIDFAVGTSADSVRPARGGIYSMYTSNERPKFLVTVGGKTYPEQFVALFLANTYGPRFTKAFKHAIGLCGGKPSPF